MHLQQSYRETFHNRLPVLRVLAHLLVQINYTKIIRHHHKRQTVLFSRCQKKESLPVGWEDFLFEELCFANINYSTRLRIFLQVYQCNCSMWSDVSSGISAWTRSPSRLGNRGLPQSSQNSASKISTCSLMSVMPHSLKI